MREQIIHILPEFSGRSCRQVSLDAELRQEFYRREGTPPISHRSPFIDPSFGDGFVQALHRKYQIDWSLGGYLEDRSFLLHGSYLARTGNYTHLGIDLNVPSGSRVASTVEGRVIVSDDDHDSECGWGPRLIIQPEEESFAEVVVILGHLQAIQVRVGDRVRLGEVLGEVGHPPANGGWYQHLHVQLMERKAFEALYSEGNFAPDGYGHPSQLARLREDYPDPSPILQRTICNTAELR